MLAIEVTVNVLLIIGLILCAAAVTYLIRNGQVASLRNQIKDLEKEILTSHAELLQSQREKIEIMKSMNQPAIPVISINSKEEKNTEKLPDVTSRKKLLTNNPAKQQSGGI